MNNKFHHNWSGHPGETLREVLTERGMEQTHLARAMGLTPQHVNRVIQGGAAITVPFAVRLEEVLGAPSAEFWLRLQMSYDLRAERTRRYLAYGGNPAALDDSTH